jgi:hypothetical protein
LRMSRSSVPWMRSVVGWSMLDYTSLILTVKM